jgi:hypothetical protein
MSDDIFDRMRFWPNKIVAPLTGIFFASCVDNCSHAAAYECAHCNERRCMACNEVCNTENIKTAVRFCPTHHEDGIHGRLERVAPGTPRTA